MVWFTNAKQANIRRETHTSQLMKGGHFTIGHDKGDFDLSKPPYQLWKWKLIG